MFELVRTTQLPEHEGEGHFYVHRETGMEVFHVKNGCSELSAVFAFATPCEDSTGVAHMLEHTVLCGSERFPLKDPFNRLLSSSPNTFANAMTFIDKTLYPFASPLKKDFDNLFDFYADSVFAPLLRKESFWQEGIRSFDGRFDGVVFNEMCGALDSEEGVTGSVNGRELYRGTPWAFDSGGDPLCIMDMTYEKYLQRYRKWYTPTNCRLFLYGDLDAQEYLQKLEDRYLRNRERGIKFIPNTENYPLQQLKNKRVKASCPSGDSNSVILCWLTERDDDPIQSLALSVLVEVLLGNPGAPLYKAIVESDLGEDLNQISGQDVEVPVMTFSVGFTHARRGAEKEIEAFFMDQFASYVRDGLPADGIDAVLKRKEFLTKEVHSGNAPFGIVCALKASRLWLRGGRPEDGINDIARLESFRKILRENPRYFEDWIQKNILDNPRRCTLTVTSSDSYEADLQEALGKKLSASLKGADEMDSERRRFEAFLEKPEDEEALRTIGRITRSDLPERIPVRKQKVRRLDNGARLCDYRLQTRGIVYLTMVFDTRSLDLEEKRLLPVLMRLMHMCGTPGHDYSWIGNRTRYLTGSFYMYHAAGTTRNHRPVSNYVVRTKMLSEDTQDVLDLVSERLTRPVLDDEERLRAALTDLVSEYESNYSQNANAYAVLRASAVFSPTAYESETDLGTETWFRILELKKSLDSDPAFHRTLSARLTKLHDKIFTRRAMTVQVGCDFDNDRAVQLVESFTDIFPQGKFVRTSSFYRDFRCDLPVGTLEKPLVYSLSAGPAYNALAIRKKNDSDEDYVASIALTSMITSGCLWNTIRMQNGAYGVNCTVDGMENLIEFSSYRDPEIGETYRLFVESLSGPVRESDLEDVIVSIIGKEIRPEVPQSMCYSALNNVIYGSSSALYRKRRKILLNLSTDDIRKTAQEVLECVGSASSAVTVCGRDMAAQAEGPEVIALPI